MTYPVGPFRRFGAIDRFAMLAGAALVAAACSGGGGPSVGAPAPAPMPSPTATPAPTPSPTPAPLPTATPTPAPPPTAFPAEPIEPQFDTAEFRRSDGPGQHNASVAWADGHTGAGVTIAVVDTGIDLDNPEFAGRISPASTDIFDERNLLEGPDDHGTSVALVAAAARDNSGILGMAWDSTLLALRADDPGSCGGDNPEDATTECLFADSAIADSIDYAAANGAQVVNISLGGGDTVTPALRSAVRNAVASGLLVVVAAGNESLPELDGFAREMGQAGDGGVLVVGSVDENFEISDFSNRAGANSQFYLAARGETICCVYEDGELFVEDEGFIYLFSGTSFAAPQVSGAAALLAQAFPNLTGRQIAEILLRSAFDAGASGPDAVYGEGILNIAAAFQPLGITSLAGTGATLALGDSAGNGSSAMGDALSAVSLPTVVTDDYQRAFRADLGGTLRGAEVVNRLHGALVGEQRSISASGPDVAIAFSIDGRGEGAPQSGILRLSPDDLERARVLAARVALKIAPNTQFGFAYAQSADGLVAQLQGHERPAFMLAAEVRGDEGLFRNTDVAFALRRQIGDWGLTVSGESGRTLSGSTMRRAAAMRGQRSERDTASFGLALDRDFGEVDAALGLVWMAEDKTLLGGHFHEGFGLVGADSVFVDLSGGWVFAQDWRLGTSLRQGFTRARAGGFVEVGSALSSRAVSLDLMRRDVFAQGDSLAFRLAQPLRVEGGALDLRLPASWDYESHSARYATHSVPLSPEGRELVGEVAWRGRLFHGNAAASLFYRRDPGHYAAMRDDAGVALRWATGF